MRFFLALVRPFKEEKNAMQKGMCEEAASSKASYQSLGVAVAQTPSIRQCTMYSANFSDFQKVPAGSIDS